MLVPLSSTFGLLERPKKGSEEPPATRQTTLLKFDRTYATLVAGNLQPNGCGCAQSARTAFLNCDGSVVRGGFVPAAVGSR